MSSPDLIRPVDVVVKVGGGLLAEIETFDRVLAIVGGAARSRRLLIVPGGGPFADAVRAVDRRIGLSGTATHWMAVLAMDQHAHLIASRLDGAIVVSNSEETASAIDSGAVAVLAPSDWLRQADPLPHSWDVTSDSIAAWVAGRVGARQLVLIKPPGVEPTDETVDPYFARALPPGVEASVIAADQIDALRSRLLIGT